MFKQILRFVAVAATAVLGACASAPGQFNGLADSAQGMIVVYRADDRELTLSAVNAVLREAERMMGRVGVQLSSPLEAGLTSGAADVIGTATDPEALVRIGRPHGVVGFIGGLATYSFAMVTAVAYATENRLRFLEERDDSFKWLHVEPAYVRSDPTKAIVPAPRERR